MERETVFIYSIICQVCDEGSSTFHLLKMIYMMCIANDPKVGVSNNIVKFRVCHNLGGYFFLESFYSCANLFIGINQ